MRPFTIHFYLFLFSSNVFSATIEVPADQPTIQAGIDAASKGDTVLVANGTYTGDRNIDIDFGKKAIVLMSMNGAELTIIDCGGNDEASHFAFYIHNTEDSFFEINGFTIENGQADLGGGLKLVNASLTIKNCKFLNNSARSGGAVACLDGSELYVESCMFRGNVVDQFGSAIYSDSSYPVVTDCDFMHNIAGDGGAGIALLNNSVLNISRSKFSGDSVIYIPGGNFDSGGGIFCMNSSCTLTACSFNDNYAGMEGGGVFLLQSEVQIQSCHFINNYAFGSGGGAYIVATPVSFDQCVFIANKAEYGGGIGCVGHSIVELVECSFNQNDAYTGAAVVLSASDLLARTTSFYGNSSIQSGGGVAAMDKSETVLINCSFSNNYAGGSGAGISVDINSSLVVEKSIIAFSRAGEAVKCENSNPSISCSDIYGNAGGNWSGNIGNQLGINGNQSEDPLFCDTSVGDISIAPESPCAPSNNDCGALIGALGVSCIATDVESNENNLELPNQFRLSQNYPNPFNPTTSIAFNLLAPSHVKLEIFSILGRKVATLYTGRLGAGAHSYTWDGSLFASGVYFYRLTADKYVESKKMILLK